MHGSTYSDFLCTCDKLFIFSSESPVFGFCISSNLLYLIKWLKKCSSASLKLSIFTFLVESLTWMHKHARKSSLMISQSSFPPFFCKYLKKPAISNFILSFPLSSVQFSRSVMSDSLWPHGLQYARLPCSSLYPRVCSNSCPLSQWCHPTISSSVVPVSSRLQSFPASGAFPMTQLFASGGQRIGALASVLPMTIQDWFPWAQTGLISLQSKGLSRVFSNTTVQKHQFFGPQLSLWSNSHICTWLQEKP